MSGITVGEVKAEVKFDIYPNPATDFVYFQTNAKGNSIVRLKDVMGNNILVERINETKETHPISLEDLCDGVYFIELENSKKIIVRKIVVQH